nr:hypothetical protein [Methanothrix harundinacea]
MIRRASAPVRGSSQADRRSRTPSIPLNLRTDWTELKTSSYIGIPPGRGMASAEKRTPPSAIQREMEPGEWPGVWITSRSRPPPRSIRSPSRSSSSAPTEPATRSSKPGTGRSASCWQTSSIHPLSAGWHATEQPDASFTARAAPMWSGWAWVRMSREISSGLRPAHLRFMR